MPKLSNLLDEVKGGNYISIMLKTKANTSEQSLTSPVSFIVL